MNIKDKFLIKNDGDKKSIIRAIDNLKLSGTSDIVKEYETKLATFFESKYAIAVSSGTAAIHSALFALNVKNGDEVIVPPTAPIMSASPILLQSAKPIFVDTNKNNFGFDTNSLKRNITNKTKAIICVPMWGYPFDYKELIEVCKDFQVPLIEDAAQAHNSTYNNKKVGTLGDIGCFSTHDRKILATGEGGFILTDNYEVYEQIKSFTQYANMKGETFGMNYKISTLQAAIGISRIDKIKWQVEVRRKNAKRILNGLLDPNVYEIEYPKNSSPNYYGLVFQMSYPVEKIKKIINKLMDFGIPSDILRYNYKVMYHYMLFKQWKRICPNAEYLSKTITTVPVHPNIRENELDHIISSLNNISEVT